MTRTKLLFIVTVILLILSMALPVSAAVANPPLDLACSLNIILVLDESGSIRGEGGAGILTEVRDGANNFLDGLADTGSSIAIVEFTTTARKPFDYIPLTSANVTNVLTPYVNGVGPDADNRYDPFDYTGSSTPSYYTNWEAALDMVASINSSGPVADLVVFFTDGNPTAHNLPGGGVDIDSSDIASHLPFGEAAADVVKTQGSHMFVLGVPNPTLTHSNVWTISGDVEFPEDTLDFSVADYAITTSDALFEAMRTIAFALCKGSVSLTKTIHDGHDYVTVPGWEFTGTVRVTSGGAEDDYEWILPTPEGDAGVIGMTKMGVTDEDGTFTWQWKPEADYPTEMELNETQPGVTFAEAQCTRVVPGQADEDFTIYSLPITITFGLADFVTCEFRNTADEVDWGDAINSYGTIADPLDQTDDGDGARHIIMPGASILGSFVDDEADGLPSLGVDGDDANQVPDDEDGVVVPADAIWNDGQGEINVTSSGPGCLNAWIDFNDATNTNNPDGTFENAGEHVITNTVVMTGTTLHQFTLPVGAIHDVRLVMRFRTTPLVEDQCFDPWYGAKVPSPYGVAVGGEVEDHVQTFGPTAITLLGVSTDGQVSRLPFLAFAILLALSMLVLAHYRRRHTE